MTPVWSQAQRAELDLEALDREPFCYVTLSDTPAWARRLRLRSRRRTCPPAKELTVTYQIDRIAGRIMPVNAFVRARRKVRKAERRNRKTGRR